MSTAILMPIRTPGVKVFHPKPTTARTTIITRRNVSSPLRFVSCQIALDFSYLSRRKNLCTILKRTDFNLNFIMFIKMNGNAW